MGYDLNKLYEGPRSERRNKRRKVNRILNILIVLVVVLIVFFGGKLIFGDKNVEETAVSEDSQPSSNEASKANDEEDSQKEEEPAVDETDKETESNSEKDVEQEETSPKPESDDEAVVTEGDSESNVVRTIENPAWQPIGTEQSEPHTVVYEEGSTDRNEIEKAVSYATALDRSDMVVWWLGRNGENSITATISSKSSKQVYRVYLDWVTNEGWRPVKIEELKENDSPTYKGNNSDDDESDENETEEDETE
ncbi:DUF1510 family protein [Fredinandcohnia humi]